MCFFFLQTRGWFYTLTVLGAALFDKPAFKNLIVNGLVLAGDGKKMSKRLKNYPGESCPAQLKSESNLSYRIYQSGEIEKAFFFSKQSTKG